MGIVVLVITAAAAAAAASATVRKIYSLKGFNIGGCHHSRCSTVVTQRSIDEVAEIQRGRGDYALTA